MAVKMEIVENLLTLPSKTTYHLEVNLIRWNDAKAKIDIRRWNEDRSKMTKGITLTEEEFKEIRDEINI